MDDRLIHDHLIEDRLIDDGIIDDRLIEDRFVDQRPTNHPPTFAGVLAAYRSQGAPVSSEASSSSAWERLRFITGELRMILHLLVSGDTPRPGVASPELMDVLMTYLKEVSRLRLASKLEDNNATSEPWWSDYRTTLEHLNRVLPKIEQQLRDDRSRLAMEQDRLSRASAWTSTSKLTR